MSDAHPIPFVILAIMPPINTIFTRVSHAICIICGLPVITLVYAKNSIAGWSIAVDVHVDQSQGGIADFDGDGGDGDERVAVGEIDWCS
jgi:hypothetical protein